MKYYPINLDINDKRCLVVGGGEIAARKAAVLKKAGARVLVVAPEIHSDINADEKIVRPFQESDLENCYLVIAATSNDTTNQKIANAARNKKILVNVVDNKELSDFIAPAIVDRDPLIIAISTSGEAPFFSKVIREELEERYDEEFTTRLKIISKYRKIINGLENAKEIWEEIALIFGSNNLEKRIKELTGETG